MKSRDLKRGFLLVALDWYVTDINLGWGDGNGYGWYMSCGDCYGNGYMNDYKLDSVNRLINSVGGYLG